MSDQTRTSPSLLGRLRAAPDDQDAWARFVRLYGPAVHGWCRARGLQEADAQDVTQELLLTLGRKLRAFEYDPSRRFRGWLQTLTHHAWHDFVTRRDRRGIDGCDALLAAQEARADLAARIDGAFDRELLDLAAANVRLRVQPGTWEAFRLTALEGQSGAGTARALGVPVGTVFQHKARVQAMLRDEVARLDGGDA